MVVAGRLIDVFGAALGVGRRGCAFAVASVGVRLRVAPALAARRSPREQREVEVSRPPAPSGSRRARPTTPPTTG